MKKKVQYVKLVEPSIKEARMRRNEKIDIHHFLMNPKYLNLGVGKNRKTEIQNEGWGGRRIFIYVFIYYNLQRWSKGVGDLGCPLCLACPCLASRSLLTQPSPLGCYPFNLFLAPVARSRGSYCCPTS